MERLINDGAIGIIGLRTHHASQDILRTLPHGDADGRSSPALLGNLGAEIEFRIGQRARFDYANCANLRFREYADQRTT